MPTIDDTDSIDRQTIMVLEDNENRLALIKEAIASLRMPFRIHHWDNAWAMRMEAPDRLPTACLISLDYDLRDARVATRRGPGCGMDVVDFLIRQKPTCPVIIHTSLPDESRMMARALRERGWITNQVLFSTREHISDWLALVEEMILV